MTNETLSVIVPVYNSKYLDECVLSIINQTYDDLEIILVDDGSTDKSGRLCDEYSTHDSRIRVIHKKNDGVFSARNAGLEEARGFYVAFIDSDDIIDPQTYEVMIDAMNQTNSDVVASGYKTEYGKIEINKYRDKPEPKVFSGKEECCKGISNGLAGFIWNKVIKKDAIKDLKFRPNIPICDDLYFTYELMLQINKAIFINLPFYHYRYVASSLSKKSSINKYMKNLKGLDELNRFVDEKAPYCTADIRKNYIFWNTKTCEQMLNNYDDSAFKQIQEYIKENQNYINDCSFRIATLAKSILRSWNSYIIKGFFFYSLKRLYIALHKI